MTHTTPPPASRTRWATVLRLLGVGFAASLGLGVGFATSAQAAPVESPTP